MTKQQKNQTQKDHTNQSQTNQQQLESIHHGQSQNVVQVKKKIIKKFPFKSVLNKPSQNQGNNGIDDELKNWRPVKIQNEKKGMDLSKDKPNKSLNFASQFLSTLPKPKSNLNEDVSDRLWKESMSKPKQSKKMKPVVEIEQKQWDGQDQFIKKPLPDYINEENKPQKQYKLDIFEQREDENEVVQKIDWLNEKKDNKKSINIADIVSKTWQKQVNVPKINDTLLSDSSEDDIKKKPKLNKINK